MQLYFIRHGQSVNNAHWHESNYVESPDPILTEIGKQQAQRLAEYLEKNQGIIEHEGWDPQNRYGFGITHIYASLMERATHTASFVARRFPQASFTAWTDIHETGGIHGRAGELKNVGLPGKPRSFFEQHYPELMLPESFNESGWWQERPLETDDLAQLRAERVWEEILARHKDRDGQPEHSVMLVSHGNFFVHLMCAILNLPFRTASHGLGSWFLLNNCSLSRIAIQQEYVTVCYQNRTDYLPDHLITG